VGFPHLRNPKYATNCVPFVVFSLYHALLFNKIDSGADSIGHGNGSLGSAPPTPLLQIAGHVGTVNRGRTYRRTANKKLTKLY